MEKYRRKLKVVLCLISGLIFMMFASTASFATDYYGSVVDPSGDTGTYDFISGSARVTGGNLILTTNFAPGTFDWSKAAITANLDVDKNPGTGWGGIDSGHTDESIFGTDYLVTWGGSSIYGGYNLWKYDSDWNVVASGFATANSAGSTSVTIPLSNFTEVLGSFNFDFLSQEVLSANTTTTILDYMPNRGSFGTTNAVPEPTTLLLLVAGLAALGAVRRKPNK